MSKSRRNNKDKCLVSSRETLVDWGALFNLIGDELDACTNELRQGKRMILEVETEYFASYRQIEEPTIEELEKLASALGHLDHVIEYVAGRLGQIRAKAFQNIARDVIRERNEASSPSYFDLDPE